ncbi:hypothetical protein MKW98_032401 [Papaver atlanticum]|uniref:Uncharacterized protein n=1 Tax=Papaver atlanticum TaxID=357466 RepID=A0AAD4SX76_9MAGN|nr:hypothetical protein MKW98_032401 [Papaver atlanticum]
MENKKNKKEDAETPILRDFFIQEIFLRLPIKSLIRFKSIINLVLYDRKNKSVRQLTIRGAEEWTDAEIYVPNLVSLNSDSSREWDRAKRRRPFKYGTSFVWQRPNKRQPAREYKVENLEQSWKKFVKDDPVLAVQVVSALMLGQLDQDCLH